MTPEQRDFGRKLREIREKRGLGTHEEAAKKLSSSRRTVGDYERGRRLPDIDYLAKFAEVAGADLNELIQLRLRAGGFEDQAAALRENHGDYSVQPSGGQRLDCSAHARKALLAEPIVDQRWSLAIMELATRGDINQNGIDRLLEFLRDWTMSDDRAWEWIESHAAEVKEWAGEPE